MVDWSETGQRLVGPLPEETGLLKVGQGQQDLHRQELQQRRKA